MAPNKAPASPCIAVCKMDRAAEYCSGCHRSLSEIAEWPGAAPERQHQIIAAAKARGRADAG